MLFVDGGANNDGGHVNYYLPKLIIVKALFFPKMKEKNQFLLIYFLRVGSLVF